MSIKLITDTQGVYKINDSTLELIQDQIDKMPAISRFFDGYKKDDNIIIKTYDSALITVLLKIIENKSNKNE